MIDAYYTYYLKFKIKLCYKNSAIVYDYMKLKKKNIIFKQLSV